MKAGTARVGGQNLVDHIATWARISEMARESFPDDSNATVIAIKRRSRPRKLLSIFLVCAFPVTNADQQPDVFFFFFQEYVKEVPYFYKKQRFE
jgi:hypothetical protein